MLRHNALHGILKESVYGADLYVGDLTKKKPSLSVKAPTEESHSTLFFHNTIICSCLLA